MARNRKHEVAAVQLGRSFLVILACLALAGAGIGFVAQKNQIMQLGQQIKRSEQRLAQLRDNNDKLRRQLATLSSPQYVERRIKELNLGLVQPQRAQIWTLTEPSAAVTMPLENQRGTRLAAQSSPGSAMP